MTRVALLSLAALATGLLLAGCGSKGVGGATPRTVIGSLPKPTLEPATPALKLTGDSAAGKAAQREENYPAAGGSDSDDDAANKAQEKEEEKKEKEVDTVSLI